MDANPGQQESATCLGCGEWENEQPAVVGASRQANWGAQERGLAEVMGLNSGVQPLSYHSEVCLFSNSARQ